jgi:hypothetical protein
MYEVSPERGREMRDGAMVTARALDGALEIPRPALGDDAGELGVHGPGLPIVVTVHPRMD